MQDVISGFGDYGRLVADVWNTGVLGISIGNILVALAIFGFFYVLRGLFTRFVMRMIDRWVENSETYIDNYLRDAVRNPIRFLFLALGFSSRPNIWRLRAGSRSLSRASIAR